MKGVLKMSYEIKNLKIETPDEVANAVVADLNLSDKAKEKFQYLVFELIAKRNKVNQELKCLQAIAYEIVSE